ncbi:DYW family of nucleic acid deaminases-domain-containing protein [Xylaria venustula]|nr:DYW family of nucleic acid deaminases-domain-containing protein [Xylaria venustula]
MTTNVQQCPKIEVLSWDVHNVHLRCPYCEEIHHHGLEPFHYPARRLSHCNKDRRMSHRPTSSEYEYILPINEETGLVGYEIDKKRACFANVCEEADDETMEIKRMYFALSDCVCGETSSICHYLKTTSEKHLFLHGRDENGNTTCILAAAEKSHEMVSLLLQNGANVDAVNNDGRSALMEAALWGRVKTVKVLINANADKHLLDHKRRSTLDLAQSSRQNQEEREPRSPREAARGILQGDSDRRHIAILLGDGRYAKQLAYSRPLSETERSSLITMRGLIHSIRVSRISKTAAYLDRGEQFPRITATSGWGHDAQPPNHVSARPWTEQVFYIAAVVGHRLEEARHPTWDQGRPGQFNASHAEKKLIAFFLDKYVFTPEDKTSNEALELSIKEAQDLLKQKNELLLNGPSNAENVEELKQQLHKIKQKLKVLKLQHDIKSVGSKKKALRKLVEKYEMREKLRELSKSGPKTSLKEAVILTSNKICDDCRRFKDRVNRYFNLRIEIEYREEGSG